jgi:hypothetical protein
MPCSFQKSLTIAIPVAGLPSNGFETVESSIHVLTGRTSHADDEVTVHLKHDPIP